jgi:hypothetical protein
MVFPDRNREDLFLLIETATGSPDRRMISRERHILMPGEGESSLNEIIVVRVCTAREYRLSCCRELMI